MRPRTRIVAAPHPARPFQDKSGRAEPPGTIDTVRAAFLLLSTGLILGYASLRFGGVRAADWNPCVLALGAVMLLGYLPSFRSASGGTGGLQAPVHRLLYASVLIVPLWALLQTVPLPLAWVAALSPARASLTAALLRFGPGPAAVPLSLRPEATLQYALRYLAFAAAFFIARDLMWRMPGRQWMIALPPLVVALAEAGVGLLQYSGGSQDTTVSGTFVNRNHFSAMLEMSLPFAAGAVADFAPRGKRALGACAGAAAAAVLIAGIVLSVSRGGFAVALLSLLLIAWLHAATRMRGPARAWTVFGSLALLACAAFALASGPLLERLAAASSSGDTSMLDRVRFWKEAVRVVAAYPLTGCGFGGFVSAVAPYRAASLTRTLDYAHNDYLQFLAEGGVVALIPACIAGCLIVAAAWRGIFRRTSPRGLGFAISCSVALFAGMMHSAADLITYVPATGMLLCWIAGMTAGLEFDRPY